MERHSPKFTFFPFLSPAQISAFLFTFQGHDDKEEEEKRREKKQAVESKR